MPVARKQLKRNKGLEGELLPNRRMLSGHMAQGMGPAATRPTPGTQAPIPQIAPMPRGIDAAGPGAGGKVAEAAAPTTEGPGQMMGPGGRGVGVAPMAAMAGRSMMGSRKPKKRLLAGV